jgi:hypothetical protein
VTIRIKTVETKKSWKTEQTIRNNGALYDRTQKLGTLGKAKCFETTADGINQAKPSSLESEWRVDSIAVDVISNVLENLVGLWTEGRFTLVGRHEMRCRGRESRSRVNRLSDRRNEERGRAS